MPKAKAKIKAIDDRQKLLEVMMRFGFGEADLRLRRSRIERATGKAADEFEASFSFLSELLTKAENVHEMSQFYTGMAEVIHLRGEDPVQPLTAMHQTELNTFKELGFNKVRIEPAKDSCKECRQNGGMVVTIEEALSKNPLPCRSCSHDARGGIGLCRCRFLAEFG